MLINNPCIWNLNIQINVRYSSLGKVILCAGQTAILHLEQNHLGLFIFLFISSLMMFRRGGESKWRGDVVITGYGRNYCDTTGIHFQETDDSTPTITWKIISGERCWPQPSDGSENDWHFNIGKVCCTSFGRGVVNMVDIELRSILLNV